MGQSMIEIAVTHRCSQDKIQYFRDNKMAVVEIAIDSRCEFGSMDEYSEYVILGAPRWWISHPMADRVFHNGSVPIDHEAIRERQERRAREEPAFLSQLRRAVGERVNCEHSGVVVNADIRAHGMPYPRCLCVKSDDLPIEFGNLAMVFWHHNQMKNISG